MWTTRPSFGEFCDDLATRFDLNLGEPMRSNVTEREDAPVGLVERIMEDNALDLQLYEFAERLHSERRTT